MINAFEGLETQWEILINKEKSEILWSLNNRVGYHENSLGGIKILSTTKYLGMRISMDLNKTVKDTKSLVL